MKNPDEYKQGDWVDEYALVVAPGLVEVEGVHVPLSEYLARAEVEAESLLARERLLRKEITTFIQSHIDQHSPQLMALDWNSQCRQLSWALGERGADILAKLPAVNKIAKSKVEIYSLTHYIRACVASVLKITVSSMATNERIDCAPLAVLCEDHNEMVNERLKLWIELVRLIPSETSKPAGITLNIIHEELKDIKALCLDILSKLERGD
jgi:hypothetical protein